MEYFVVPLARTQWEKFDFIKLASKKYLLFRKTAADLLSISSEQASSFKIKFTGSVPSPGQPLSKTSNKSI